METKPIHLLPHPRQMSYLGQTWTPPRQGLIHAGAACLNEARILQQHLSRVGTGWQIVAATQSEPDIQLQLSDSIAHEEGYTLHIEPSGVQITARSTSGIYYAIMTLKQLIQQSPQALPALHIEDWPDYPARGVMLDISRDRVPRLDQLFQLVEELASWKINQLQLYMEHSFAYSRHRIVWELASPLTGEEILLLDAHCQRHHIELVPNQNSLGHMERWLKHPPYRNLAEKPEGFDTDWADYMPATTLDPADPQSLALITGLYDELLPHFSSHTLNVGCDEPWELGKGKNAADYAERGGRVYLDWMLKLHREVTQRGHTMQFWGDIILHHPELVPEIPQDTIIMNWGYEATHDFEGSNATFAKSGIPFFVCPGTSSWNSLSGRTDNAIGNILNAARSGLKHGAIGLLNTDWGDLGHWQPPSVSLLGYACAAALSWCLNTNENIDLRQSLNRLVFADLSETLGGAVWDLGNIYQQIGPPHINGQVLARVLQSSQADLPKWLQRQATWGGSDPDIRPETLHRVRDQLIALQQVFGRSGSQRHDAQLIHAEFSHVTDMLLHSLDWLLLYQNAPRLPLHTQAQVWERLIYQQRHLWLQRSRPGGLEDSMRRFETLRQDYAQLQQS